MILFGIESSKFEQWVPKVAGSNQFLQKEVI